MSKKQKKLQNDSDIQRAEFIKQVIDTFENNNKKLELRDLSRIVELYDSSQSINPQYSVDPYPTLEDLFYDHGKKPTGNMEEELSEIYNNSRDLTAKEINTRRFKSAVNKFKHTFPTKNNLIGVHITSDEEDYLREVATGKQYFNGPDGPLFDVRRFTPQELAEKEIKYDTRRHILVDYKGNKASTIGKMSKTGGNMQAFVLDENSRLYIDTHPGDELDKDGYVFTHAALARGGRPVILAGELEMRAGKIYSVNSESGHYKPVALDMYFGIKAIKNKMPNAFKRNAIISYWDDTGRKVTSLELFIKKMETIQPSGKPLWKEQLEEKEAQKQQYTDKIKSYSAEKPKQVNLSEHRLTQHMKQSQRNDINMELGLLDSDDQTKNRLLKNRALLENNLNNLQTKKLVANNTNNDMKVVSKIFIENKQELGLRDKIIQAEQNLDKHIEAMKLMEKRLETDQQQDKIRLKNSTLAQVQAAIRKRVEERDVALKKFFELKGDLDKLQLIQSNQNKSKSKDNHKSR